jgi:hypothetical protein
MYRCFRASLFAVPRSATLEIALTYATAPTNPQPSDQMTDRKSPEVVIMNGNQILGIVLLIPISARNGSLHHTIH